MTVHSTASVPGRGVGVVEQLAQAGERAGSGEPVFRDDEPPLPDWAAKLHMWLLFQHMSPAIRRPGDPRDRPRRRGGPLPFLVPALWVALGLTVACRVMPRRV